LSKFTTKDSGARAEFSNGGVRDTQDGKPRFDLVLPKNVPYLDQMLTRWAALMGRGAEKYTDRNWEQFADETALERAYSSAIRHLMQWANGETDEDHAAAVFFNVMVAEYVKGVLAGEWEAIKAKPEKSTARYFINSRHALTYRLLDGEMRCKYIHDEEDTWDPSCCDVRTLLDSGFREVNENEVLR
jgi:hypothetical protein